MWNLITDKSNQELVDAWVFDSSEKKLSPTTEKEINDKVEQSFQGFLNEINMKLKDQPKAGEKELIEGWFNEWLNNQVNGILDAKRIEEIKDVNENIEQSLKNLSFQIELSELEAKIQDDREAAAKSADISTGQKIDVSENQSNVKKLNSTLNIEKIIMKEVPLDKLIDLINTTNFNERDAIIDCLNAWKREDIRKMQCILIWKDYIEKRNRIP